MSASCIQLPWQRGWCWVQLGSCCQVTAELWEWRRGAWALGGGWTECRGYEHCYKESEQQRLEASLRVKKKDFFHFKIFFFLISLSAPSCQRILILGCITEQLYSLEKTHKQNTPCQQHKAMRSILQQGNSDHFLHEQRSGVMSVLLCVQRSGCTDPAHNMTTQGACSL